MAQGKKIDYEDLVDRSGGPDACHPWLGRCNEKGYGLYGKNGKVHRVGFERHIGPIPAGRGVLHQCDNPPCQNPAHWFIGTPGDNARDRASKNRGVSLPGETNPSSKLTLVQVAEIRKRYAAGGITLQVLGDEYGVSKQAIWLITKGKKWKQ